MKARLFFIALTFLMFSNTYSQKKSNGILFLEFKFDNGIPQLISTTLTKGKLKTRKSLRTNNQEFSLEVISKKSNVLYKTSVADPSTATYEYPGENGEIKRAEIKQDVQTVTVRIPYCSSVDKVILYKKNSNRSLQKTAKKNTGDKFEFNIDPAGIFRK
jgi:hypothetical protein